MVEQPPYANVLWLSTFDIFQKVFCISWFINMMEDHTNEFKEKKSSLTVRILLFLLPHFRMLLVWFQSCCIAFQTISKLWYSKTFVRFYLLKSIKSQTKKIKSGGCSTFTFYILLLIKSYVHTCMQAYFIIHRDVIRCCVTYWGRAIGHHFADDHFIQCKSVNVDQNFTEVSS